MKKPLVFALALLTTLSVAELTLAQVAGDAIESVQIRSIDLTSQVLELHNFGTGTQLLDGWRFCSHDETDGFDYTSPGGLNGQSLDAGESLFIHWDNDAAGANAINIASLGGNSVDDLLAAATGEGVSIGLYRDSSGFGSSTNLVDHIQYSFAGSDISGATPRAGVATSADLWTSSADWIAVNANSTSILLSADPFPGINAAHGATSYSVIPEPTTVALAFVSLTSLFAGRRQR